MAAALRRLDVAVVGAGAAGLVTARELRRAGHGVTVYEASPSPGGVWVYTDEVEEGDLDGRGQAARSPRVHSSMYAGLRTNLPRLLMSFSDFPFDGEALAAVGEAAAAAGGGGGPPSSAAGDKDDRRTYPGHAAVRAYLAAFEAAHGLGRAIRYGCRVVGAEPVSGPVAGRPALPWPRWRVEVEGRPAGPAPTPAPPTTSSHLHDALMVCTGHFAVPRTPELDISPAWVAGGGLVLHSHNYRSPTAGRLGAALAAAGGPSGAVVAVLGAGPSGEDLARELSPHCASVLLCAARWEADRSPPAGPASNIRACPWIVGVGAAGDPAFAPPPPGGGGPAPSAPPVRLTALVLATGYRYCFDGLLPPGTVSTDDNHVRPLADHLWPPAYAPGLALIGLPFKVVPFPLMEAQARRAGAALSGAAPLPPPAQLAARAAEQAAARAAAGIPPRHAHCLSGARQWDYMEGLAAECVPSGGGGGGGGRGTAAAPFMPAWRPALYAAASAARKACPDSYRDDEGSDVVVGEAAVEAAAEARAWAAAVRERGWSGA